MRTALSPHAVAELRDIAKAPVPTCGINPGVLSKLMREHLVMLTQLPSPFKTHKGRYIQHAQLTANGEARLRAIEEAELGGR